MSRGSSIVSAKDQAGFTTLKFRDSAIKNTPADYKSKLLANEQNVKVVSGSVPAIEKTNYEKEVNVVKLLMDKPAIDEELLKTKYNDDDVHNDDDDDDDVISSDSDDDDDDDDDEDDELELQRELERIKAERLLEKQAKEREEKERDNAEKYNSAIKGNPLMKISSDADSSIMKRRWNDDVVFRNQAKGEPEKKKRFINDTVRNDFHKSFLKRYIQ